MAYELKHLNVNGYDTSGFDDSMLEHFDNLAKNYNEATGDKLMLTDTIRDPNANYGSPTSYHKSWQAVDMGSDLLASNKEYRDKLKEIANNMGGFNEIYNEVDDHPEFGQSPLHLGGYNGGKKMAQPAQQPVEMAGGNVRDILNSIGVTMAQNLGSQIDHSKDPYVKNKDFYDQMTNIPIENTREKAQNAFMGDIPMLINAYSGNTLASARDNVMPILNSIMKGDMGVAEQASTLRNDTTKRKVTSDVLSGMNDVTNPNEAIGILKQLEASTGTKYDPRELAYKYQTSDQVNDNKSKALAGLGSLYSGIFNQDNANANIDKQIASHERIAQMTNDTRALLQTLKSPSSGSVTNAPSALKARNDVYKMFETGAKTSDPNERKEVADHLVGNLHLYGQIDPKLSADIINQLAYWYPDKFKSPYAGNGDSPTPAPQVSQQVSQSSPTSQQSKTVDMLPVVQGFIDNITNNYGGNYDPNYNIKRSF